MASLKYWQEETLKLCSAVLDSFSRKEDVLLEFYPPKPDDRESAYLWSVFATTGMLYAVSRMDPAYTCVFRRLIGSFSSYRSRQSVEKWSKYHSERGSDGFGTGPCFYDDNIWIARNLLFAYDAFGDTWYLEEAERVVNYVRAGWNEELGGLVWNERGLEEGGNAQDNERGLSANACSALVHGLLYQKTGKSEYLAWALRFYSFCETMRDPVIGVYHNGIHTLWENGRQINGAVNRDQYAYNSGLMILTDLVLYEITTDTFFLDDAKRAARAVHQAHLQTDPQTNVPYYKDFVWFTAIQAEAYTALLPYDQVQVEEYMAVLERSLKYACQCIPHKHGLLPHAFSRGWGENDAYDRMLLTHSAIAEIACLLWTQESRRT